MKFRVLVVVTMVGCTVGGAGGVGGLPSEPSADGGADSATESLSDAGRADARRDDGGGRDAAKDVSTPDVNVTVNATSCGAVGHDCLGALCSNGICGPERLRDVRRPRGLTVTATDLYIVDRTDGYDLLLQRGAKTPGGGTTVVAGPGLRNFDNLQMKVAAGYIYLGLFKLGQGPLHRRPLSGGGATDEVVAPDVSSYDVDDAHVTYSEAEYPRGSWLGGHTSAAIEFPTTPSSALRGSLRWLTLEGSSVFGIHDDDIYEASVQGAATASLVGPTGGTDAHQDGLIATPTAFYGTRFSYANPVTCASTTFSVWRRARVGGATSDIHVGSGWVPTVYADAIGALYTIRPCGGSASQLMAYRESDGATYVVAELDSEDVFAADDTYVYFTRWQDTSIYRVAR